MYGKSQLWLDRAKESNIRKVSAISCYILFLGGDVERIDMGGSNGELSAEAIVIILSKSRLFFLSPFLFLFSSPTFVFEFHFNAPLVLAVRFASVF